MKMIRILSITALSLGLLGGCKEDESPTTVVPPLQGNPFEIRAWNYSTNYFFVDTSYRRLYEPYYSSDPPIVVATTQMIEEEVWVQRMGAIPDPNERQGVAFITLSPRPLQGYDSTLRQLAGVPGEREPAPFIRLNRSQYELIGQGFLGVVALRAPMYDQQVIGIAYRRVDGQQFGEFARDVSDPVPLVLKMIKPRNLNSNGPTYRVAWDQLLKSVYSIGSRNVREVAFELKMHFGSASATQILNQPLLRVLGLDRFNQDGTPSPNGDGQFDFRPGITINQANGELILPSLDPFVGGIRRYFISHSLPLPDSTYYSPAIYDTTKTFAQIGQGNNYFFSGRALSYY